jgi:hypothetical protein
MAKTIIKNDYSNCELFLQEFSALASNFLLSLFRSRAYPLRKTDNPVVARRNTIIAVSKSSVKETFSCFGSMLVGDKVGDNVVLLV